MSVYVDIEKRLGDFRLKAKFEAGNEVLALLGASGCGKSMTLKCIAGIEKPDRGIIKVDDVTLFDSEKHINLSPQKRHTGLMFQNYALFPNMTVRQNIYTGTKKEKDSSIRNKKIDEIMESFGLTSQADHLPSQLSGGQQQRTALARIFVSSPNILLLDEPFSALDSHLRFRLEQEIRQVFEEYGKSVILVSHDRDEVFRLSDKIAVMDHGDIEAFGTKKEVFANPTTKAGAVLTGCKNISKIAKINDHRVLAVEWGIEVETENPVADAEYIGVRMHDICAGKGQNGFVCDVVGEIENPFSYTIMLKPSGKNAQNPIGIDLSKERWKELKGEKLEINIPAENMFLLKDE